MKQHQNQVKGFTLVEMTLAILIAGILMVGMEGLLNTALQANRNSNGQNDALQQARFAMQQMVRAVSGTRRLMLPLADNPATVRNESVRDVLAVTLDPTMDRDKDGWADANNDKDYLDINNNGSRDAGEPERIDEDLGDDMSNDGQPGIINIDDDGDGVADESDAIDFPERDDDEEGDRDEDFLDGIDDDGDGSDGEDGTADMNKDFEDGVLGIDDDGDGSIDEGHMYDDDEDGSVDEDWLDPVVFFLNGTSLMQRIPNINPADGTDYTEYPIADNVSQLEIKRILANDGQTVIVDITLQISPPDSKIVNLNTQVRVSGSL